MKTLCKPTFRCVTAYTILAWDEIVDQSLLPGLFQAVLIGSLVSDCTAIIMLASRCLRCQVRAVRYYSGGHNLNAAPESAVLLNLKNEVKQAMRAKDKLKISVVKDILAQVVNASKTKTPIESDNQMYALLRSSIAKRLDSAASFREHGRNELAETEETEAEMLRSYVPKEMEERDIQAIVVEVVNSINASQKDMSKVLKALATRLDESVAPKAVQVRIVKSVLASGSSRNVSASQL